MAIWYQEDWETRALGPVEGLDTPPWIKASGAAGAMTVVNTGIIGGTKSAKLTAVASVSIYLKDITKRTDYTIQWKGRMDNIVLGSFGPGPLCMISMRTVETFISTAWGITFKPKANTITIVRGTTTPGQIATTIIPFTTFTAQHTYDVTVAEDRTMQFSIDSVVVFGGWAISSTANQLCTIGSNVLGASMDVVLDDFDFQYTPAAAASPPKAPANVFSVRRKNYTLVFWDKVTQNEDDSVLADVTRYEVTGSTRMNESNAIVRGTITTTDTAGKIDTAFVDVSQGPVQVHRVKAIVVGSDTLESAPSNRAVSIQIPSQVDTKDELIDTRLFVLDQSLLDEAVLV